MTRPEHNGDQKNIDMVLRFLWPIREQMETKERQYFELCARLRRQGKPLEGQDLEMLTALKEKY